MSDKKRVPPFPPVTDFEIMRQHEMARETQQNMGYSIAELGGGKPKEIVIKGAAYRLLYKSNDDIKKALNEHGFETNTNSSFYGFTPLVDYTIYINDMLDSEFARSVIYHEAMHALLYQHFGGLINEFQSDEESIVKIMTALMHETFKIYKQLFKE